MSNYEPFCISLSTDSGIEVTVVPEYTYAEFAYERSVGFIPGDPDEYVYTVVCVHDIPSIVRVMVSDSSGVIDAEHNYLEDLYDEIGNSAVRLVDEVDSEWVTSECVSVDFRDNCGVLEEEICDYVWTLHDGGRGGGDVGTKMLYFALALEESCGDSDSFNGLVGNLFGGEVDLNTLTVVELKKRMGL